MTTIKKLVPGQTLSHCSIYTLNGTFPSKDRLIIKGIVYYSSKNEVIPNAGVVIHQLDASYTPAKFLYEGITFTDELGQYGISMPWNKNSMYEIKAYGP